MSCIWHSKTSKWELQIILVMIMTQMAMWDEWLESDSLSSTVFTSVPSYLLRCFFFTMLIKRVASGKCRRTIVNSTSNEKLRLVAMHCVVISLTRSVMPTKKAHNVHFQTGFCLFWDNSLYSQDNDKKQGHCASALTLGLVWSTQEFCDNLSKSFLSICSNLAKMVMCFDAWRILP